MERGTYRAQIKKIDALLAEHGQGKTMEILRAQKNKMNKLSIEACEFFFSNVAQRVVHGECESTETATTWSYIYDTIGNRWFVTFSECIDCGAPLGVTSITN